MIRSGTAIATKAIYYIFAHRGRDVYNLAGQRKEKKVTNPFGW